MNVFRFLKRSMFVNRNNMMGFLGASFSLLWGSFLLSGCASRQYTRQDFPQLQTARTLEHELEKVWKGAQAALKEFRLEKSELEENEGELRTEWMYSTSQDKYIAVKVNGVPRRKALQTRVQYRVFLKRAMMGTDVQVAMREEIERLHDDGTFDTWESVDTIDSARAHGLIKRIEQEVLAARP